jgi:hypothetical protein
MSEARSPYYPPRARWYAPVFNKIGLVRRITALDRVHLPSSIRWRGLFGAFLVPGLGFYLRGPRLWGQMAMLACACLFLIFMVWLGHPAGNYAIGFIISIHTSSFVYYCKPIFNDSQLSARVVFTLAILLFFIMVIYSPMRNLLQNHWLTPIQLNNQVIIVEKVASADSVQRGDWVAYMASGYYFSNHYGRGVSQESQLGLAPVLAVAGDKIFFSSSSFTVNGRSQPLLPHMPQSGSVSVPSGDWFIWPNLSMRGNWNVGEDNLSSAMLELANVPKSLYVGKPLQHWFWRKQILQ